MMARSFEHGVQIEAQTPVAISKGGAGTDDHRPCTNPHQPIVNEAWRGIRPL
jgi:hypothetical protein